MKRKNPSVNPEIDLDIRDGMARCIWLDAYARFVENQEADDERDFPAPDAGDDWDEVAPETPQAAMRAADDLIGLFADNEKMAKDEVMSSLFALAAEVDTGHVFEYDAGAPYNVTSRDPDNAPTVGDVAVSFGHYMAAAALGQGVSWFDDHKSKNSRGLEFKPTMPSFEVHFDGEELSWSGRADGVARASGHQDWMNPRVAWTVTEISLNGSGEFDDLDETSIGGDSEAISLSKDERDDGWTIVDKAVMYLHAKAQEFHAELEASFHGSPHSLNQGPERKLTWTVSDEEPIYGRSQFVRTFSLDGFTWQQQRQIFERIYREEWEPHPTRIGRIIVVNPDETVFDEHRYLLWFGEMLPTYLLVNQRTLTDALDECLDWIEEHQPGMLVDDQVHEEYERQIAAGASEDKAYEEAEADTTSGGNHGVHIMSDHWGVVAEDPTREQLRQIGRGGE